MLSGVYTVISFSFSPFWSHITDRDNFLKDEIKNRIFEFLFVTEALQKCSYQLPHRCLSLLPPCCCRRSQSGSGKAIPAEESFPSSRTLPLFTVSVLLPFAWCVPLLKLHMLCLKMQTKDPFWSRAHSEVVSLSRRLILSERITNPLKIKPCHVPAKLKKR